MEEKKVIIALRDGNYEINNNEIDDFTLIGVLECLLFDLKSSRRRAASAITENATVAPAKSVSQQSTVEAERQITEPAPIEPEIPPIIKEPENDVSPADTQTASPTPDLRIRIGNAVKAIRSLGGQIEETNLALLTDEELQSELEALTNQYKRLKNSRGKK